MRTASILAISSLSHLEQGEIETSYAKTMIFFAAGIGIFIGLIVGALGAGGGILSIPVLIYLLSQTPHVAAAESLIIVGLTSLVSLLTRLPQVRWREGFSFGLLTLLGALAGARLNILIPETILLYSFSILLLAISTIMLRRARQIRKKETTPSPTSTSKQETKPLTYKRRPFHQIFLTATGTGLLTGFFGIGGGVVIVPILIFSLGFPMSTATATSLLVMVITSILGLLGRIGTELNLDLFITLIFAAGSMLGGLFGARITRSLRDSTLTFIFALLLATISLFIAISTTMQLFI